MKLQTLYILSGLSGHSLQCVAVPNFLLYLSPRCLHIHTHKHAQSDILVTKSQLISQLRLIFLPSFISALCNCNVPWSVWAVTTPLEFLNNKQKLICILYNRGGQLDELRKPHCRRQLRQEPCLYLSRRTYGTSIAHCLRRNKTFSYIINPYFCSTNCNGLVSS
jgi:hypothetical protein